MPHVKPVHITYVRKQVFQEVLLDVFIVEQVWSSHNKSKKDVTCSIVLMLAGSQKYLNLTSWE